MMCSVHVAVISFIYVSTHTNVSAIDSPYASPEALIRPAVIVFNPDNIIWPFNIADVMTPIFKKNENVIIDRSYKHLRPFRQASALLAELHRLGHQLAVISQCHDNQTVCELLSFFRLDRFINYTEVYPGNWTEHVEAVHIKSEIDYGDMLYLVDDYEKVEEMADLGMVCTVVGPQGVTMEDVKRGFHVFNTESPEYSYSEDSHESSYLHKE
uniref:Magnesium-dependent phosphatase 1 n=1 Tax=Graphocephala atropunctata TaxID=36148 RepID=A0A1B6MT26_9HEMI